MGTEAFPQSFRKLTGQLQENTDRLLRLMLRSGGKAEAACRRRGDVSDLSCAAAVAVYASTRAIAHDALPAGVSADERATARELLALAKRVAEGDHSCAALFSLGRLAGRLEALASADVGAIVRLAERARLFAHTKSDVRVLEDKIAELRGRGLTFSQIDIKLKLKRGAAKNLDYRRRRREQRE